MIVPVEPAAIGFPGARSVIRVKCKQDRASAWENRYYLSSHPHDAHEPGEWLAMIRAHWSVENKNHWRKDAVLREDDTRSRSRNIVSNLALLWQLVLFAYEHQKKLHPNFKAWIEHNRAKENTMLALANRKIAA